MSTLSSRERSYAVADKEVPPPFPHVVCGVDATPESREAVRQSATLAGPGGRVAYLCAEPGENDVTANDQALADALAAAENLGAEPTGSLSNGVGPAYALIERAGPDDLVVIGSHDNTRVGGILSGSVATMLLHRARSALLIARPASSARPFPRELLVASDGSPSSLAAVRLAAAVARRHHAHVSHLHVGVPDADCAWALADERRILERETGAPPTALIDTGPVPDSIAVLARERRASLLVVGNRGLSGVRALTSVSERVGHSAPCSVLVAPPLKAGA